MSDRPTPQSDHQFNAIKTFCQEQHMFQDMYEFSKILERKLAEANEVIENIKTRLLDPHGVYISMLYGEIAKLDWAKIEHIHGSHPMREQLYEERALADRLAEAANVVIDQWETPNWKLTEPTATCMNTLRNTLAAWKEARCE